MKGTPLPSKSVPQHGIRAETVMGVIFLLGPKFGTAISLPERPSHRAVPPGPPGARTESLSRPGPPQWHESANHEIGQ
eukprot:755712-Hanusia_phi.AAC.3